MRLTFEKDSFLSAPPQTVFEFHETPDAFRLLSPKHFNIEVLNAATTLQPSEEIVRFAIRVLGIRLPFSMVHTVYEPPERFVDEQLKGVFSTWKHEHRFIQGGWRKEPATLLRDRIDCSHPLLRLAKPIIARRLKKLFAIRHEVTRQALQPTMVASENRGARRVIVTGATGLIGGRVTKILLEKGCRVTVFARDVAKARRLFGERVDVALWDFNNQTEMGWTRWLSRSDAVVHLAGTPLFSKRWSPSFKKEMTESRTLSTRWFVQAIAASKEKPSVFVSGSAVGFYGLDPFRLVDERSQAADDLLARICLAWEHEAQALDRLGVRTVLARAGVVLSPESGALKEMLPLFKLGLGGVLGKPNPWINWIHLEDMARILVMAVFDDSVRGPINAVAPHPVTNRTFAHTLAHVLRRPSLMRFPTGLLRLAVGEAAEYASGGSRVSAALIRDLGYDFFFEDLEPALRNLLKRPGGPLQTVVRPHRIVLETKPISTRTSSYLDTPSVPAS